MTALATNDDVAAALGRPLESAEESRSSALLTLASADVTTHCGWRFAPGTYTITREVNAPHLKVPATTPTITAIRRVDPDDLTVTTLTLGTDYYVRGNRIRFVRRGEVEIDFTVAASVPSEVAAVVAGIVANTLAGPAVGTSQQQAGPFIVSYVNSSGKVWLAPADKRILRPWTVAKPALSTWLA